MQASKVNLRDQDNSFPDPTVVLGIAGFRGITERGPVDDPSIVINNATEYRRIFGNELSTSDFPALCLRYLNKGGKLRISRVGHYATITDPTTLAVVKPGEKEIKDVTTPANTLFKVNSKYPGAAYNNLKFEVKAASNGQAQYFDVLIYILGDESNTLETYKNLTIPGQPTIENSTFLNNIILDSKLVNITYVNLSGFAGNQRPVNAVTAFTGGSNGGAATPTDYIGAKESQSGFNSFDRYSDMFVIGCPAVHDTSIHQGGFTYAQANQELMYYGSINRDLKTTAGIIAERANITVSTKYAALFHGGLIIIDPITQQNRSISELADVIYLRNKVNQDNFPWISASNWVRATVSDAVGVVTNWGADGQYSDRNALAERQINVVVANDGRVYVSGNLTAQMTDSKASFINIVMLVIYLKKILRPLLEKYIDDPVDLELFRAIYRDVDPILQGIKDKRGLYDYRWDGDQDISNIRDVQVNNLDDIDNGIYKAKLGLEPIAGLILADITISINRTGSLTIDTSLTLNV